MKVANRIFTERALSQVEVVDALAAVACKQPDYARLPRERILRAGGHPKGPKLYFGMYFDMPPITMVVNKAQRILKLTPTDFSNGLRETYRWYIRKHPFPPPDYAFENELIALAHELALVAESSDNNLRR